ncbi:MAG: 23S rRNA (adenine(2030)-N(6))-methyltransferase RlmJ [Gammaproteobacteria bacterium]|nr:23S rRNA (adenine(2030)-N(6))-methyltransferase RlmJ [Gammaproteobacteria bacterium]
MKYRHAFHAGNFADVHKHVTLLALLRLLTRKDKGLLLLDTHAGRGLYDLTSFEARKAGEAAGGIERVLAKRDAIKAAAILDYLDLVRASRKSLEAKRGRDARETYPGSPLLALGALRAHDRVVLIEAQPEEHSALREATRQAESGSTEHVSMLTIECADGFERLAAWLPPIERRALVLIDPPYEDSAGDFRAVERAAKECLRRLANAVIAIWYPIKHGKDTDAWRQKLIASLPPQAGGAPTPTATLELWIHPLDNRVGLNGSGMLVINPPYQFAEQAAAWLPVLHALLDESASGGSALR